MPATLRPPIWHGHLKAGDDRHVLKPHRSLFRAALPVALAVLVGAGIWIAVDRFSAGTTSATPSTPAATAQPFTSPLTVTALQQRLRAAGYAITVTGVLDPVTRSAAADYLTAADVQTLGSVLAGQLSGTVLTMRQDVDAWNARFGNERRTRLVERPLTGPNGQLDSFGNVQASG